MSVLSSLVAIFCTCFFSTATFLRHFLKLEFYEFITCCFLSNKSHKKKNRLMIAHQTVFPTFFNTQNTPELTKHQFLLVMRQTNLRNV